MSEPLTEVDARGLSCPEPVMLAADALKQAGTGSVRVLVSNATARDNVKALALKKKRSVAVEPMGEDFAIVIS